MKVVLFANNRLGAWAAQWLAQGDDEVVAVVVHPDVKQKFRQEILEALGLPQERVFYADELDQPRFHRTMAEAKAEIGLSVLFDYLLSPTVLAGFAAGVINLHPSYLPYNRGNYPNVWSIVEKTPSGVTLHYMDKGIDTGDIIAQVEVPDRGWDTGKSLYERLELAAMELLGETWPLVRAGQALRRAQPADGGSFHRARDVETIDRIDLDAQVRAGDLIDVLRARSFPPYKGAFFMVDGRRVYMRLDLEPEPTDQRTREKRI